MRLSNGRMRGNHSFSHALAVGATVAAVAVILALVAGVARAEQSLAEIAADLPVARTLVVAGVVLVLAVAAIQIVDATVFGVRAAVRILIAAVMFVAAAITSALSHEAPTGWSFDPMCCGSGDCYQVPDDAIGEGPGGYIVRETGEVIPYQSYKAKNSPDGMTYRCSINGDPKAHTYCIYKPKGGV